MNKKIPVWKKIVLIAVVLFYSIGFANAAYQVLIDPLEEDIGVGETKSFIVSLYSTTVTTGTLRWETSKSLLYAILKEKLKANLGV